MHQFSNILVIAPHPDDESIGCGGTIHKHGSLGARVKVVFLTSGENGGHGLTPEDTKALREEEAAKASRILGVTSIDCWRLSDGGIRASAALVTQLTNTITEMSPDLILAPYGLDMHRDHRATVRALRKVASTGALADGTVLMYEVWTPIRRIDHIEDISDSIGVKLEAIKAHATQCREVGFVEAFRGLARYRGELHSWPGGPYAEVFERLEV